jgi:hypothetical protein
LLAFSLLYSGVLPALPLPLPRPASSSSSIPSSLPSVSLY